MYNVLICDDQPDIVNALKIYLAPEGYGLFTASTGLEALDLMQKEDIHLILLDIMMPGMDGITATAKSGNFPMCPLSCSPPKVKRRIWCWDSMWEPMITSPSPLYP